MCAKLQNGKLGRNKYTTGKYCGGKHEEQDNGSTYEISPNIYGPLRGVCENSIPRKTLCKYSKPYWSNKFTHLSKKLKDARKKKYTPM